MSSAASPFQTALYARLNGDGTLSGMIEGIFDDVPENQALPYVTIGEMLLSDWSTFAANGQEIAFVLHTWSQADGRKGCQAIMDRMDTLLNRSSLAVAGFTFVACLRESEEVMLDPDGQTYHGVQRFRAYVHA